MKTTGNRISILWRLVIVSGAFACAFTAGYAGANGTNPTVVAGQASFSAQGSALNITNSPGTIINWQGFSIGAGESTRFIQQSATSSVLNRVLGSDPSVILGTLTSNGRVFLINPGGILFGQGSRIDVAGLVASTLPLSNQDFLANRLNFTTNPLAGSVENQGSITTPSGGSVYLVGTDVINSGIINSPRGDILLAAGHSVNILDSSTPGVRVEITASGNAAVNLGEILAQSGEIGIYGAALRNSGIINADQIEQDANGRITLRAKQEVNLEASSRISADATTAGNGGAITVWSDDIANVAGTITARGGAHSGDGGFIETSGVRLSIADNTRINTLAPYGKTGTWLLDPTDFTIAASGGDMTATTLATNLLSSDVTILSSGGLGGTNGDINVNEAVVWDRSAYAFPATVLTLNAVHDVNINTAITATKGSVTANAGHNINVNAAITTTDGNVVLRADSDGTGPGVAGGTITFIPAGSVTTTRGAVEMYFNPVSYAVTQAEIDAYLPRVTISDGTKNASALVFAQGSNKTYDGTDTAALSFVGSPTDGGDVSLVVPIAGATFSDRNAANGKTINFTGVTLGGTNSSRFSLFGGGSGATTANITQRALTVTAVSDTKTYSGTNASAGAPTHAALQSGDTLTTFAQTFDTVNAGSAKTLTATGVVSDGNFGNNYTYSYVTNTTGQIDQRPLTATVSTPDKVYNGDTTAAPTLSIISGLVTGETVTASGTATFNSKDVLAANLVTVNSTTLADGTGLASNYSLASGQTATAHITPAALTATVTAPDKVYNGNTTAAPVLSITTGLVSGETVTATGTATFNSKDVLAANLVTVNSTTLADGTGLASNYSLASGQTATAHITPATLTATVTAPDKVYNGTTTAAPTLSITAGLVSGETITASGTATFNSKDVLDANLVTVNSTALADGTGLASNYSLAAGQTVTTHITPAALTATVTAPDKVYNGNTTAAPTLSISSGLISGETVTATGAATFNSKDVLAANLVTVNSTTLADGTGLASNYSLASGQTATAHITPAVLTATVAAPDKVYNGTTTAAPTLSITAGLVSGETVTATGTATFNSKDVLAANLVTVNSTILADGSGLASNYSLASGQTATAHITPAALTATVAAPDKVYNGTTTAAPTLSITAGLVSGETVTATGTATFNSKDVLAANLVTVNSTTLADGTGLASNYSMASGQTATAHITPAVLTATVAAPDKVYNGTTTAAPTLSITAGLVSGETVTASGTATFNSMDVLAANLVTVNSTILADGTGLASNYSLASGQTATAHITPAVLTATVAAPDKVYNGTTTAAPTLSITAGLISGETVTASGTATFNSKDVLAANLVTVNSATLADGTGLASNYSLAAGQTATAHITPAALTATVAAPDKVYNGNNTAAPTISITAGLISGETVTATGTATFNSKDVLTANLVTVNSTTLANGTGLASNYSLAAGQTATAHITPTTLTATVTAPDKVYNGTTTAAPTLSITGGLISGETVTATGTATFNSKDVLTANLVTVNSTALANGSGLASNYSLAAGQTATAHITPAALSATVTAPDKVYNGNTTAAPTLSITSGLISGETVTATGTATFNSKDVLTANLVTVNSTALANGSGLASNYSLASGQTATSHITPAPLGIAANSATRLYGDGNPAFSATYSGFQNSENAAALTGTLAFATSSIPTSNVGNYAITPSGQNSSNYSISYVNGALGVTPAPLGIAANSSSKTYGDTVSFTGNEFSSNGLKNGETIGSVSLSSAGAAATAGVTASPYNITASSATGGTFSSGNYTLTYVNGALGVTPAALGIAANSSSKIYGDTASFTGSEFSSSGLKNGETIGSVNLTSAGAAASADVADGPYGITASAATGGTFNPVNYSITYVDGSLGVIPAGLLGIAANSATKIYDGLAYSGGNGVSYTGFKAGDSVASLDGTLTYGGSSQGAVNVGGYAIIPSGQSSPNYTITYVNGNLGVIPAPLGIAANSASRLYGDNNPAFSATYSGFQNGENAAALAGALAFATSATPSSDVGSYAVTPSGQSSSNYTITYVNGALGVTPAPLGIAADSSSKTYGATASFTGSEFSSSGLKNGETIGSVSLASTGTAATAGVTGSPYSITASSATGGTFNSGNYAISYVDGSLGVTPAQLSITANNASRLYGESNPGFNATYSGFQNGENAAALAGELAFATSATPSSNVGNYAVTPGGQSSANYAITFANGALQVTPVSLTVSTDGKSKVYGTNDPALTFSVTGLVNNTALGVIDTPGSVFSGALIRANGETVTGGPYTISQGSLTANSNYTLGSFTGSSFTITPAPLTVAADQQSKLFGTPDPALTFSTTGLVNNPALGIADSASSVLSGTLTRDPGESALGGPYPITQGTLAASGNYALAYTGNNFIITGAAAEPVLGFNAEQVVFAGVVNREYYYRPGNFWHISLNPDNADPGFDVMRGTSDFNQRETRRLNRCDSVFRGGFCETMSFPQQIEKEGDL